LFAIDPVIIHHSLFIFVFIWNHLTETLIWLIYYLFTKKKHRIYNIHYIKLHFSVVHSSIAIEILEWFQIKTNMNKLWWIITGSIANNKVENRIKIQSEKTIHYLKNIKYEKKNKRDILSFSHWFGFNYSKWGSVEIKIRSNHLGFPLLILKKIQHRKLKRWTTWTSPNIRRGKPRWLLLIFISTDFCRS
jgi:hypothetical protein